MSPLSRLARFVLGADARSRRMMGYWAATALMYSVGAALLLVQIRTGTLARESGLLLCYTCLAGMVVFFILVRASAVIGITASQLAVMQALFAIASNAGAYAIMGPVRGASLMILLVVIVFCTFSLRPRATLALCAVAVVVFGATMYTMSSLHPARFPLEVEAMHFALVSCSMVFVSVLTGEMSKLRSRLKQQKEELVAALATIRTLATVDELTSLANRRYMNEVLHAEERRHESEGLPVCLALLDLDFFKNVNDRFGHDGGDTVLRAFAGAARAGLRMSDMLARWGGEEFLLLLPATDLAEAEKVLARMAERVAAIRLDGIDRSLKVTFSCGLVTRRANEPFSETVSRADKAMYQAKATGRDRVVSA